MEDAWCHSLRQGVIADKEAGVEGGQLNTMKCTDLKSLVQCVGTAVI